MSTKTILKNLHYFLNNVLLEAHQLEAFDEESFQGAMKWADYCEQLYATFQDQSCAEEFDKYVQQLAAHSKVLISHDVQLKFLQNAAYTLQMVLLQNSNLSNLVFERLMKFCRYETDIEYFIQLCHQLSKIQAGLQLLINIHEHSSASSSHSDFCHQLYIRTQASLFLRYIHRLIKALPHPNSSESCIFTVLKNIGKLEYGLEIIITMAIRDSKSSGESIVVVWILNQFTREVIADQRNFSDEWWSLPFLLLSTLSQQNSTFFQMYIKHLNSIGKDLVPKYEGQNWTWSSRTNNTKNSYPNLLGHLQSLCAKDESIEKILKETIKEFALQDGSSLWQELLWALH